MTDPNKLSPFVHLPSIRKALCEKSLWHFIAAAWHIVEPGKQFIDGPHIRAICLHLQAATEGRIRNLCINIPPRCMKSLLVAVMWPAWVWTTKPEKRFIFASYGLNLSKRDSLKCRRIIRSPWYQAQWGDRVTLTNDQNAKERFENTRTGFRLATSVEGMGTGEGGDYVVADDPHNVIESMSVAKILTTTNWWDEVIPTRLNDQNTGVKVIIMQRVAHNDLSGHVIEKKTYDHLCLPMRYEKDRHCTTSIWTDWRSEEGELLWPERFNADAVKNLEIELGIYGTAGQLQQRPMPRGGGLFKREWFSKIIKERPATITNWVRFWDMAASQPKPGKKPDWTSGCLLGEQNGIYYLADIQHFQGSPLEVQQRIKQTAMVDGYGVKIWMEQEPGSSGVNVIDYYAREVLKGFAFYGERPTGPKPLRADPVASAAQAGNIVLIEGNWIKAFLDEIELFGPLAPHDDQVDSLSGAFKQLRAPTGAITDLGELHTGKATEGLQPERLRANDLS